MSDIAIRVENLSKQYRIGGRQKGYRTIRETIIDAISGLFRRWRGGGRLPGHEETIWALEAVSFEVRQGEVLGIIGRNGAGKSTLLKILSRITEPTEGRVELYGRVGSLLEIGAGFHPELTGRENIFLNGAIIGMRQAEIRRKFDEIAAFAEIEKFIDTPIKRYSSGMYVRLAFAVAAHLEPEILLVDEVLAVGDAQFQKKCLGKMSEVAGEGRTVLFVSHNMAAVQSLCNRAIWLEEGNLVKDGQPNQVVSEYLKASSTSLAEQIWDDVEAAPGNDVVRLHRVSIRPERGTPGDEINIRTPLVMEFEYWNLKPGTHLNLSISVYNQQGIHVFATTTLKEPVWHGRPFPSGLFRSICHIPGDLLNDGMYRVQVLIVKDEGIVVHRQQDALVFDIKDSAEVRGNWYGQWPGVIRPALIWKTEYLG
jgi:lipopolysaccharide transport system ATP-binding protein